MSLLLDSAPPLRDQFLIDLVNGARQLKFTTTEHLYRDFKLAVYDWIFNNSANQLTPKPFVEAEIIQGCTQYIDSLYIQGQLQHLDGDYQYHKRLGNQASQVGKLKPNIPLIMAMPFPLYGDVHPEYKQILEECRAKNIDIHIDSAWITSAHNITFDYTDPQIKSYAVSLSKGMGLGWNRIGVRYAGAKSTDSVTIMNSHEMNPRASVMIGLDYLQQVPKNYLWSTYEQAYNQVCKEHNLIPTKCIHMAKINNRTVGVSQAILSLVSNPCG